MKLRIEGNSIRLRLRKSEVQDLAESGRVGGITWVPGGSFKYVLELKGGISELDAQKTQEGIIVYMPEEDGKAWVNNQRVGFDAQITVGRGLILDLLVEKDFVCLDRDPALQKDQYPNPKAL